LLKRASFLPRGCHTGSYDDATFPFGSSPFLGLLARAGALIELNRNRQSVRGQFANACAKKKKKRKDGKKIETVVSEKKTH